MHRTMAIIAASSLALAAQIAPLQAEDAGQAKKNIIVEGNYSEMIAQASRDLDRQLELASRVRSDYLGNGVAIVRFHADADGRPANMQLYKRSGSAGVDRLAQAAVHRLDIGDLARSLPRGQLFQANIIVADSRYAYDRLADRLARQEAARMASSEAERAVVALGYQVSDAS